MRKRRRNTSFRRIDVTWTESISLDKQEYGTRCITLNGEIVRSKGERQVADFLFKNNIRYKYEPRVYGQATGYGRRGGNRNRRIIGKPDFLLLDYDILVEYWGMVTVQDAADRANYQRKMNEKKLLYEQNGYKLISLYRWDLDNLQFEFNRQLALLTGDSSA
jgi:DNA helicase-4